MNIIAAGADEPDENRRSNLLPAHGCIAVFGDEEHGIGAMVELNCYSEFAARAGEFVQLARDIAKQIAVTTPRFISKDEIPADLRAEVEMADACLVEQCWINEPEITIQERIDRVSRELEDDVSIRRFVCFKVGEAVGSSSKSGFPNS
jgi:elongation factor Ts